MTESTTPPLSRSNSLNSLKSSPSQRHTGLALSNARTTHNIYILANPRSGDGFASNFLEKYPRANRTRVEVYVTRRAGAIQFILPENLRRGQQEMFTEDDKMTLDCTLLLFNVLEASERTLCMDMLEDDIQREGSETRDRYLGIMGGDGSLATTLKMLRTR